MRKLRLLLLLGLPLTAIAQLNDFAAFKKYPFVTELTASPSAVSGRIAWAMDEEGRRNVYVAEGPDFAPRRLTEFMNDDGQEITSLSISADGQWVVFVRGGDHGANWDNQLPVNPGFSTVPFKVQVGCVPWSGGAVRWISEGDDPVIAPDNKEVVFIKSGQVWWARLDSAASPAKNLFTTRGNVGSLQWSPDGKRLLFVAGRTDHSVIGIYTTGSSTLKWIAPSFSHDESPQWSEDGSRIAFVRMLGSGGAPDSLLVNKPVPWWIYVADTTGGKPVLLWESPPTLRGSYPSTDGGDNLHWGAGNKIVFLSYEDGWPHLYSVDAGDGREGSATAARPKPVLLTPGKFMCEHIKMSTDRRWLLFSANTGTDPLDIERRHAVVVGVDGSGFRVLTPGNGLEWTPVMTGDSKTVAFFSATAQRPPLPAVVGLDTRGIHVLGMEMIPKDFPVDKLVTPRQVVFRAEDGVEVHADLFMPAEGGSSRRPAIVYVHGGPPRQMLLGWHYSDYYSNAYASNQYLASLGFVVLSVNYRLGIGYGYDFHRPPHAGAAGAAEYKDIKAAGRWLRRQSFVDSTKVGIYGGSYGGYLTALALARDSRLFAAGVDFHGVHNWLGQSSLEGRYRDKYEKAPDYEKALKTAWESSPVSAIAGWRSPVLIVQGDDDRNVRFNQSIDLINRLEQKDVPYETLTIVDDTHHWLKWANAVTVYGATADFFTRKFMGGK
jgi:dipeptidyl aminopeptidase/acylaminoacyl peptidase